MLDVCPCNADYTQERFVIDALRHWQNHTPLYPPGDDPAWLHEGISLANSIESADMKEQMRQARNG